MSNGNRQTDTENVAPDPRPLTRQLSDAVERIKVARVLYVALAAFGFFGLPAIREVVPGISSSDETIAFAIVVLLASSLPHLVAWSLPTKVASRMIEAPSEYTHWELIEMLWCLRAPGTLPFNSVAALTILRTKRQLEEALAGVLHETPELDARSISKRRAGFLVDMLKSYCSDLVCEIIRLTSKIPSQRFQTAIRRLAYPPFWRRVPVEVQRAALE